MLQRRLFRFLSAAVRAIYARYLNEIKMADNSLPEQSLLHFRVRQFLCDEHHVLSSCTQCFVLCFYSRSATFIVFGKNWISLKSLNHK